MHPELVDVSRRPDVPEVLPPAACAEILAAAIDAAGAPPEATISLILSHDTELAALNEEHMGVEGPTDVLSFPLLPPSSFPPHPGQAPAAREVSHGFALPPDAPPHLGDVVVSVERAIQQARTGTGGQTGDRAWTPADELRLLIVHGGLHICGWDHADRVAREAMRALERNLLGLD